MSDSPSAPSQVSIFRSARWREVRSKQDVTLWGWKGDIKIRVRFCQNLLLFPLRMRNFFASHNVDIEELASFLRRTTVGSAVRGWLGRQIWKFVKLIENFCFRSRMGFPSPTLRISSGLQKRKKTFFFNFRVIYLHSIYDTVGSVDFTAVEIYSIHFNAAWIRRNLKRFPFWNNGWVDLSIYHFQYPIEVPNELTRVWVGFGTAGCVFRPSAQVTSGWVVCAILECCRRRRRLDSICHENRRPFALEPTEYTCTSHNSAWAQSGFSLGVEPTTFRDISGVTLLVNNVLW